MARLRRCAAAFRRRVKAPSRGQSLVELALILPVFMLFFATILDLGRIAAAQVAIQNAAREGAFQASETPTSFDSTSGCPSGAATNKVYCRIKLESSGGVTIDPADVTVACNPIDCSSGMGNTVTVRVNGHFRLLTPLMGAFFGGNQNVTFTAQSVHNLETLPVSSANPGSTPTPTPTATATATATPTATAGCTLPSAGFTYTYSPANKKAPQAITFTDTSTSVVGCSIDNWEWTATNSGGTTMWTSTQQNPGTFNYLLTGTYFVQLRVHNAAGSWVSTGAVQIIVK